MTATRKSVPKFDSQEYHQLFSRAKQSPLRGEITLVDLILADLRNGKVEAATKTLRGLRVLLMMNAELMTGLLERGDEDTREIMVLHDRLAEQTSYPAHRADETVH